MIVEAACKTNSSFVINRIAQIDVIELKHLLKFKKVIFQCSGIWWLGELIKFCSYCQKKSDDIITQEDVEKVEQLVIDKKDPYQEYLCARDVKGVDITRLQEKVENSGVSDYIYMFARDVEGADIDKLRTSIFNTKDQYSTIYTKRFIE